MKRIALLVTLTLVFMGCTQWGTNPLRRNEVWWACTDRNAGCSPEDALLTLLQMDNSYSHSLREMQRVAESGQFLAKEVVPLLQALARARDARDRMTSPPSWGPALADYVQANVDAERIADRFRGRLYAGASR